MSLEHIIFLFFAGAVGGAINAVAGGGSFVTIPALLFTGVPPVSANATNTLALWVGTTASGGAYRKQLDIPKRIMIPLIVTSEQELRFSNRVWRFTAGISAAAW